MDDGFSKHDLRRTLDLAAGHLDDAEDVLWKATAENPDAELDDELEALTHDLWALQQQLQDLQAELDQQED